MKTQTLINIAAIFSGRVVGKLLAMIIGIILARYLGPENYGKYSFATSICFIFMVFSDFGMDDLLVRDISADRSMADRSFGASLVVKTFMAVVSIALLWFTLSLMHYSKEMIIYSMVFAIHIIFIVQINTINSIFRANERMEYSACIIIINGILGLSFISCLVYLNQSLLFIIFSRVVVFSLSFLISLYLITKVITRPNFNFNVSFLIEIAKKSFPFLTIGLINTLTLKFDILMLSKMKGEVYVGYYAAAANDLFFSLFIIPGTVTTVVYPIFSRQYRNAKNNLRESINFTIKLLTIIGVPLCIGAFILADQIIYFLFGPQYQNSIIVLRIIAFAISFMFIREPFGFGIAAIGKEKMLMWMNFLSLVLNIMLNIILIPLYSHVGAAITSVGCIILTCFLSFYYLNKTIQGIKLISNFYKPIISGIIMGGMVFLLRNNLHVLVNICVGAIVYSFSILLFRTFSESELKMLKVIR